MIRSILVTLFLTLIYAIPTPAQDHAQIIPENAILFIQTPSVPEFKKAWQGTDLYKLSQLSEVNKVSQALLGQLTIVDQWQGLDLGKLWQSARHSASFSILLKQDGTPVYIWLFDGRDSSSSFADAFATAEKSLENNRWKKTAGNAGELQARITNFVSPLKGPRTELALAQWQETYCLTSDGSVARELAERALKSVAEKSIANKPAFSQGISNCKLPVADVLQFYCDPIELAQVYQADPEDGIDPRVLAQKHGFGAIKGLAGRLSLPSDKFDMQFRAAIDVPSPYLKSMQLLDFKNSPSIKMPDWIPDYSHTVTMLQMDLTDLLTHISGPLNDVTGEGTLEEILQDMKSQDGPGVDLQTDLFDFLSENIFSISESNTPVTSTSERTLLCIEVTDPAKVASCIRALLVNEPNAQSQRLPGQSYELWKYGLTESEGPNLSSAGVMVANGHLLLASNTEAIRKLVLTSNGQFPRLNAAEDVKRLIADLEAFAGSSGFLRQIIRIDRDMMSAYELLREGKTEGSESMYAQFLERMITKARRKGKALPDFAKLPEFQQVEKYLGISCGQAEVTESGWLVSGFILRK